MGFVSTVRKFKDSACSANGAKYAELDRPVWCFSMCYEHFGVVGLGTVGGQKVSFTHLGASYFGQPFWLFQVEWASDLGVQ